MNDLAQNKQHGLLTFNLISSLKHNYFFILGVNNAKKSRPRFSHYPTPQHDDRPPQSEPTADSNQNVKLFLSGCLQSCLSDLSPN